jgi:hypothetical protein
MMMIGYMMSSGFYSQNGRYTADGQSPRALEKNIYYNCPNCREKK